MNDKTCRSSHTIKTSGEWSGGCIWCFTIFFIHLYAFIVRCLALIYGDTWTSHSVMVQSHPIQYFVSYIWEWGKRDYFATAKLRLAWKWAQWCDSEETTAAAGHPKWDDSSWRQHLLHFKWNKILIKVLVLPPGSTVPLCWDHCRLWWSALNIYWVSFLSPSVIIISVWNPSNLCQLKQIYGMGILKKACKIKKLDAAELWLWSLNFKHIHLSVRLPPGLFSCHFSHQQSLKHLFE